MRNSIGIGLLAYTILCTEVSADRLEIDGATYYGTIVELSDDNVVIDSRCDSEKQVTKNVTIPMSVSFSGRCEPPNYVAYGATFKKDCERENKFIVEFRNDMHVFVNEKHILNDVLEFQDESGVRWRGSTDLVKLLSGRNLCKSSIRRLKNNDSYGVPEKFEKVKN